MATEERTQEGALGVSAESAIELAQAYDEAAAVCRRHARERLAEIPLNGERLEGLNWRRLAVRNRHNAFVWRQYAQDRLRGDAVW